MNTDFETMMQDFIARRMRFIEENKEMLVEAWIAETGLKPSESMLVIQDMGDGTTRIWVQRREP